MMGTQLVTGDLGQSNWGIPTYKLLGLSNMIHISTDLGMEIKS